MKKPQKKTIKAWANRCAYLNDSGRQCLEEATRKMNYHGDREIYGMHFDGHDIQWVKIYLCKKHYDYATK